MAYYDDYYVPYQAVGTPITPAHVPEARRKWALSAQQRMPLVLLSVVVISALLFGRLLPTLFAGSVTAASVESSAAMPANTGEVTAGDSTANDGPQPVAPVPAGQGVLASVFTREVKYWEPQILEWSSAYGLDPNLVAIIMQIESCGDPGAVSGAGAQGLFQVMPFHFAAGEDTLDPNTNAQRGINYFVERLAQTGGDVGRAFAGYNGGHVAAASSWDNWAAETQRYYRWSTGIYDDIQGGLAESPTVQQWLAAGGASLCNQAASRLGLQ